LAILYTAIVASYIAYLCYWTAIKYIGASNAGIGELCFGSFFAVAIGYFVMNTTPSVYQLLGLGLLSGGIFLVHKEQETAYDA
jgi:drug/metabolite transporter (DMT)-like permease